MEDRKETIKTQITSRDSNISIYLIMNMYRYGFELVECGQCGLVDRVGVEEA